MFTVVGHDGDGQEQRVQVPGGAGGGAGGEESGARMRFSSAILPAWARKSLQITEVLPLLYPHGLSTSDFAPALGQFLGSAAGLSAPVIARLTTAGDEALGFWAALSEVFPATRAQRCWFHRIANVLSALPKSAHPGAEKALAQIWNAEDGAHARTAAAQFATAYGPRWPEAAGKITNDLEELLAFYDYPAEHWVQLRTTNPIESTFATVRHRTKITFGPGSKVAGLAVAFRLIEAAQRRWRCVNAPHLVALVRAAAVFEAGTLVERPDQRGAANASDQPGEPAHRAS